MNQILMQKWFLLQNIKHLSYFRNGVFNKEGMDIQRCCLFDRVSTKFSKFKLKHVYATKNTPMHCRDLLTYVQNLKAFLEIYPLEIEMYLLSAILLRP
jgi:hypothetical protein